MRSYEELDQETGQPKRGSFKMFNSAQKMGNRLSFSETT